MVTNLKSEDRATRQAIIELFDDMRVRLVETGTRNRLVHVNRANTRGSVLNIVNKRSDEVHALLYGGKTMGFLALGHNKDEDREEIALTDAGQQDFDEERNSDAQLGTRLGPDALQKKLLKIARDAQTAEEESGVNLLYLAMGFLTWYEDKASSQPREAPLALLPVKLERNARTSTYNIRARDEDALTNLPLQQRLKEDFGIDFPELEIGEDWKPSDYFAQIESMTNSRHRWKIDPDAIQLGFFSFSKLLMYRDLAAEAWPDDTLTNHALTRGLLYEGLEHKAPLFDSTDKLDAMLPPEKLFHVVDADASQAKVIEEVRSGRNLVVQGPPGTGKSQTITNIVAAAAMEGRRVLFVAEKKAALSVVHDRLVKVGLRDVCLELHSEKADKKSIFGELNRTLSQASAVPEMPGAPTALKESRDRLNDLAEALHRPIGTTGETAYNMLGRQSLFIGNGYPAPRLNIENLCSMSRQEEARLLTVIARYDELLAGEGQTANHPFEGTRNLDLQPTDLERLKGTLTEAQVAIASFAASMRGAFEALALSGAAAFNAVVRLVDTLERLEGLPGGSSGLALAILAAPDIPRLHEASRAGAAWREAHDEASGLFMETVLGDSFSHLRGPLAAGIHSSFARWGGGYRRASRELAGLLRESLPKTAAERVERIDRLTRIASLKSNWENDRDYCGRILGDVWRGEKTDFAKLLTVTAWCERLSKASMQAPWDKAVELAAKADILASMRRKLREGEATSRAALQEVVKQLDLDPAIFNEGEFEAADLDAIATRLGAMAAATARYESWKQRVQLREALVSAGLASLEERMRLGDMDGTAVSIELRYARADCLWKLARTQNPDLRDIASERRHDLVGTFTALERQRFKDNVTTILANHLAQIPQGTVGEMRVIRGEILKKRGHIALRRLFKTAGEAIQRIKPVLLMSPISVAQFLPPGTVSFDLLVIDEASQVRPESALGAIARANQIVVVGDKKQLPPSSFFDRLLKDEENDKEGDDEDRGPDLLDGAATAAEMESILTLCEARGLQERMLKWHYRSRDPSLIEVSNREFYDNALVLPPSPLQKDSKLGLCFTRVNGIYDKSGKRDNREEGKAIVDRITEHARANPSYSLGIVTFSLAQCNCITELLEYRRREDITLDRFLREKQTEDLFVKNIENVQGDERDVILVSVGYGPVVAGGRLVSMSFGPVNREGGERRLNVLFTRARVRCEVFVSFDPGDIDLSRAAGEGPRILKRFLEFAKNGQLEEHSPTGLEAESFFEEDVAKVIRGYDSLADPQVGSAGWRIDLGIRHPDRPGAYILAVECDGATYHRALWARERDRLRQDVLEHLGWRFHRIWSTDWFYNRSVEVERLRAALFEALDKSGQGLRIEGTNRAIPISVEPVEAEPAAIEVPNIVDRQMPPYRRAVFRVGTSHEPHEAPILMLAELAWKIVNAEGPIHEAEVARRLAACFGKEKAGSRISEATKKALPYARSNAADLLSDGSFWYTRGQADAPPVRNRSAETGATLKAENISLLEIKAAFKIVRDDNAGGNDGDLVRTVARLLGFSRVGPELHARIVEGL